MYLYNVTIIAENELGDTVKQCIDAQLFDQPDGSPAVSLLEMLDSPHEGTTYCIQLRVENSDDIPLFQQRHIRILRELLAERYPGRVLFFDSIMKYLND